MATISEKDGLALDDLVLRTGDERTVTPITYRCQFRFEHVEDIGDVHTESRVVFDGEASPTMIKALESGMGWVIPHE